MLKLFLQRIRFNLRNLFAKKIVVPTNFKSFEYTNPKYQIQMTLLIILKKFLERKLMI
jgi:hypothetical protein